ncbi:MAG: hypothetical protein ACOCXH_14880, partial [Cyclobacteriaceae bacterium]
GHFTTNCNREDLMAFKLDEIKRIASGDRQFMIELINICIEQFSMLPLQLKQAFDNLETKEILNLMHKIKPSIKMLNNWALDHSAKELVKCFKDDATSEKNRREHLDHFSTVTRQINEKLKGKAAELQETIS